MKTPPVLRFTRRERVNFPRDKLSYDVTPAELAAHSLLRRCILAHSREIVRAATNGLPETEIREASSSSLA